MNEYLDDANGELRRVDHLIHVSLKYTRTVDVLKNVLNRLINCFDFCFLVLLAEDKDEEDIPKSPGLRTKILREKYEKEKEIIEFINFYHHLRDLSRANFERSREFRRHVTMTAFLKEGPVEITIDVVTSYFKTSKVFYKLVCKMVEGEEQSIKELLNRSKAEIDFERV